MKVKLIKILMLMLTIILLLGTSQVLAIDTDFYEPDTTDQGNDAFVRKAGQLLGVISAVGTVCSVVVISVLGIKYMLGSVEEKAEYKKTMTVYVTGAVLLFSCTTIPNMIYNIVNPAPYVFNARKKEEYVETIENYCFKHEREMFWYGGKYKCPVAVNNPLEGIGCTSGSKQIYKYKYYCGYCNKELSEEEYNSEKCSNCYYE